MARAVGIRHSEVVMGNEQPCGGCGEPGLRRPAQRGADPRREEELLVSRAGWHSQTQCRAGVRRRNADTPRRPPAARVRAVHRRSGPHVLDDRSDQYRLQSGLRVLLPEHQSGPDRRQPPSAHPARAADLRAHHDDPRLRGPPDGRVRTGQAQHPAVRRGAADESARLPGTAHPGGRLRSAGRLDDLQRHPAHPPTGEGPVGRQAPVHPGHLRRGPAGPRPDPGTAFERRDLRHDHPKHRPGLRGRSHGVGTAGQRLAPQPSGGSTHCSPGWQRRCPPRGAPSPSTGSGTWGSDTRTIWSTPGP